MKSYIRVFLTFARNSLVRDMTFRANFIIDLVTWMAWMLMNLVFYMLIFRFTPEIGVGTGWTKYPFFIFIATSLLVNSIVEMFFMMNMDELSELIRTGALDFALVKPMDTQFLVSLTKTDWSAMGNFFLGLCLLGYSLLKLGYVPRPWEMALVSGVYRLRSGDILQPDGGHGRHQRVAGPESDAFGFLVFGDHVFPVSDGDISRPLGHAAAQGVYVYRSHSGGGERSRPIADPLVKSAKFRRIGCCRYLPYSSPLPALALPD